MSSSAPASITTYFPVPGGSDFTLANLPFGIFSPTPDAQPRPATRLGDTVIDLAFLSRAGLLPPAAAAALADARTLNAFMAAGRPTWRSTRAALSALLGGGSSATTPSLCSCILQGATSASVSGDNACASSPLPCAAAALNAAAYPAASVTMHLPAAIGNYTDFYSSRSHATNVGIMFRGAAAALQPNWLHMPIGYSGRASSVVVSGTAIARPVGQIVSSAGGAPTLAPSAELDFELEVGTLVGPGTSLGERVPAAAAEEHIFGLVLLNDWSARDIQRWEYVPLGPFGAKNFGTLISPWVVTLEALEPFRAAPPVSEPSDPPRLPFYVGGPAGSYDVQLEVEVRASGGGSAVVSRTNFRHMYWDLRQQLAHHTLTGCNLVPGDLMGSGTISGPVRCALWSVALSMLTTRLPLPLVSCAPHPSTHKHHDHPIACLQDPSSFGSMLELAWRGTKPVALSDGSTRSFIEDGDEVIMRGWAERDGVRVGFGECAGVIVPARLPI